VAETVEDAVGCDYEEGEGTKSEFPEGTLILELKEGAPEDDSHADLGGDSRGCQNCSGSGDGFEVQIVAQIFQEIWGCVVVWVSVLIENFGPLAIHVISVIEIC